MEDYRINFNYKGIDYSNLNELVKAMTSEDLLGYGDALLFNSEKLYEKLRKQNRAKKGWIASMIVGGVIITISPIFAGIIKSITLGIGLATTAIGSYRYQSKKDAEKESDLKFEKAMDFYEVFEDEIIFRAIGKTVFPEYYEDFPYTIEKIEQLSEDSNEKYLIKE